MWRKRKAQQVAPSSVTGMISWDKSKCAKRQFKLTGTLRHIGEHWKPDDPERPDEKIYVEMHEDWKRIFFGWWAMPWSERV
jgi:hypothetical protein